MTSSQKVDVKMKHRLPSSRTHVQHSAVSLLDVALACNLSRRQVAAANHFGVFGLRLFQSRKMFPGNDQHMRGSLRVDVFKGQHVLVLVNLLGGNFAAENAAEKAVAGRVGHAKLSVEDSIGIARVASSQQPVRTRC